jgi:LysR family glycine cleavage system transcriptional activator
MRRRIPPLNAIRAFEAVARHEHLGHAADELCVSHSALSQQVKHLEEWFGRELFKRSRGRLMLKPEGKELLEASTTALDVLQQACNRLRGPDKEKFLIIQCDPAFFSKCLIAKMPSLRETAGITDIEISTVHELDKSFPDDVDIVIHYQKPAGWQNVHTTNLLDIYGFPACSPALLEQTPAPESPDDLRNFHLLHGDDRESWKDWLRKNNAASVFGSRGTIYDDFGLTIQAAVNGEGVIIADSVICREELESGQLVPLFSETVFCVSYQAFCPKEKLENATVKSVFEKLVKEIRQLQPG